MLVRLPNPLLGVRQGTCLCRNKELKFSCHERHRFIKNQDMPSYCLYTYTYESDVSDRIEEFNSATYIIRTSLSEDVETSIVQDVAVH